MASLHNGLERLETIKRPSKASPEPFGATDMAKSCISTSTTEYDFFVFPAEIRNMIYHHLLQASYTGVGWYPSHRHFPLLLELRIEGGKYRPESDRLSILRVGRQIRHEAMCFLYRHSTFCFEVQSPYEAAPGGLGVEALSLIQFVDIRVDTGSFMHPFGRKGRGETLCWPAPGTGWFQSVEEEVPCDVGLLRRLRGCLVKASGLRSEDSDQF